MHKFLKLAAATAVALSATACAQQPAGSSNNIAAKTTPAATESVAERPYDTSSIPAGKAVAIFAGGCFWCMEPPFDALDGVEATISGYTDGRVDNPTYKEVSGGYTGHTEGVKVVYDPDKVSYQQLLDVFWVNIDPTAKDRQFCDAGSQYRSGIYPLNEEQRRLAEASKAKVVAEFGTVYTEIEPATTYYDAEEYHQDYYQKNSVRYNYYRYSCGRDKQLRKLWGDRYQK